MKTKTAIPVGQFTNRSVSGGSSSQLFNPILSKTFFNGMNALQPGMAVKTTPGLTQTRS